MEDGLSIAIGFLIRFVTQGLKNWFKIESESLKFILVLALSAGVGYAMYYAYPGWGTPEDAIRLAVQMALAAIATQAAAKNISRKTG